MASEILSATPEASASEEAPDTPVSDLISEDVTLIARGRRKRFRIH
jgi:hypothetical protein